MWNLFLDHTTKFCMKYVNIQLYFTTDRWPIYWAGINITFWTYYRLILLTLHRKVFILLSNCPTTQLNFQIVQRNWAWGWVGGSKKNSNYEKLRNFSIHCIRDCSWQYPPFQLLSTMLIFFYCRISWFFWIWLEQETPASTTGSRARVDRPLNACRISVSRQQSDLHIQYNGQ